LVFALLWLCIKKTEQIINDKLRIFRINKENVFYIKTICEINREKAHWTSISYSSNNKDGKRNKHNFYALKLHEMFILTAKSLE
jgi:hypothetical protein